MHGRHVRADDWDFLKANPQCLTDRVLCRYLTPAGKPTLHGGFHKTTMMISEGTSSFSRTKCFPWWEWNLRPLRYEAGVYPIAPFLHSRRSLDFVFDSGTIPTHSKELGFDFDSGCMRGGGGETLFTPVKSTEGCAPPSVGRNPLGFGGF